MNEINTNTPVIQNHSTYRPINYGPTLPKHGNSKISLSLKDIQQYLASLKRQFPLVLHESSSFHRAVFILKILKERREWVNKKFTGTTTEIVNEVKNLIFNLRLTYAKGTITGYSYPYTFDSITDNELHWFVNNHHLNFIQSQKNPDPILYDRIDNPEDYIVDDNDDEDMSVEDLDQAIFLNGEDDQNGVEDNAAEPPLGTGEKVIDSDINDYVESAKNYRSTSHFDYEDLMLLELFDILREAGAPMYVFDRLTEWGHRNANDLALGKPNSRKVFFKNISKKTYGPDLSRDLKPINETHCLPSCRANIGIVRFSFKAKLASLLLDEDLMSSSNLLINADNPFEPHCPKENTKLNDLNTGWWHGETSEEICKDDYDILLPLIFFIDAGKVTQRQSIEPVTFTLGIFDRKTRNRAEAWRTLGYMENLGNAEKSQKKKYNSKMKLEDYHYILSVLFQDVKVMQGENGGFRFNLTLNGTTHNVIFKIAIQNMMGDCMGLDKLCLFYGSNSLDTARMCRDCDVPPCLSDDPDYKCRYTKISDLDGLCKDGFKKMSVHKLPNFMKEMYFGARDMCIYQCSPGEPLHAILLGLFKYEYEVFEGTIPKKCLRLINHVIKYYYNHFSKQSCREMPTLAPFQNGIENCDVLGAKEQYARLFGILVALNNREVIRSLCTQPRHVYDAEKKRSVQVDPMKLTDVMNWYRLIEDSLILYQWIMSPEHDKSDVTAQNSSTESKGQLSIRDFMRRYKSLIENRGGHGVKLLKFHQLLHYTKEIRKDGSIQNIDTGRCESIAVTMYKRIAIWTQRRQMSLTKQLAERHLECVTAIELGRHLTKSEISEGRSFVTGTYTRTEGFQGSTFTISLVDCENEEHSYLKKTIMIDWKGVAVDCSYHSTVYQNLTKRLYLNTDDGECLRSDSVVTGKTEYVSNDGTIFRAHPNFRSNGKWYDWCNLKWSSDEKPVPAKIIMFLDLSGCSMMSDSEIHRLRNDIQDEIIEVTGTQKRRRYPNRQRVDYLSKDDMWVVVRSAISRDDSKIISASLEGNQNIYTVKSKIISRILLEDDCRILPVSAIDSPCYVLPGTFSTSIEHCSEFFVLDDMTKWDEKFLE